MTPAGTLPAGVETTKLHRPPDGGNDTKGNDDERKLD